jgi:lantibiotic modifying enzyme
LEQSEQAVSATTRNFPSLMNDSLCHGRSGNAELFLSFAELCDEPAFRLEANVQARSHWDGTVAEREGFFPGLMLGLSGVGMHLLRLARPERIPSVLLLDAPPT